MEKICRKYSQMMDPFYFVLPKSRMREFSENPFDYLSRANGMKNNVSERGNIVVDIHEDPEDDLPILPLMNDDESDDELLESVIDPIEQIREEQIDNQTAEEEERYDTDIPDADQLGRSSSSRNVSFEDLFLHRIFNTIST